MTANNSINTSIPIPIASGGTAGSTAPNALTNLGALPIAGGTMTGNLILNTDPTVALGAVTKQYADAIGSGLTFKDACYATTTANLNATYVNGVSGVGATLVNAGSLAAFSLDGTSPPLNARILVKNQTTAFQNGIYTLTTIGTGVISWVLTRSTDYNSPSEIAPGNFILVDNGTTNANTGWIQTATVTTIGTSSISFSQFGNAASLTASYILQTSNSALPNAQVLGSLSTGIVKNTATTGVLSIAISGTDYYSPGHPTTLVESGGNLFISNTSAPSFSSGTSNLAIGPSSLFSATTGSDNTAIGAGTGANLTTGSFNTFLGLNAGSGSGLYTQCVLLGAVADCGVNNLTNAIAIGYGSTIGQSNAMSLGNGCVVGIGISSSILAGLHVKGGVQNLTNEESVIRAVNSSASITSTKIEIQNTLTGGKLYEIRSSSNGSFDITDRTGSVTRLVILTGGNVGIGTTAPDNLLSVNGSADKTGGGSWGTFSDIRLKHIISNYSKGLDRILQITPRIYTLEFDKNLSEEEREKKRIGIIAQEIEHILPECIEKRNAYGYDDLRYYDSSPILYVLINAIKELNEKIDKLSISKKYI
jgi:Chaperone of endosialidase